MLMKPHVKMELDRMRRSIGMRAVLFTQSKARYPGDDYYDDGDGDGDAVVISCIEVSCHCCTSG